MRVLMRWELSQALFTKSENAAVRPAGSSLGRGTAGEFLD